MGDLVSRIIAGRLGRLVLLLFGRAVFTPNGGRYINVWRREARVPDCILAIAPREHGSVGWGIWRTCCRDGGDLVFRGGRVCTSWHFGRIKWTVIPPTRPASLCNYIKWIWYNA